MFSLSVYGKSVGPYEAIWHADGTHEGDMLPILHDAAEISLSDGSNNYSLCYKTSKTLFGGTVKFADVVNMSTGESFSFQVSNIFVFKVIGGDVKLIAKVGDTLKYYEYFGKTEYNIESDGDKKELTPLGYFDMFVRYDDNYYYPLMLDPAYQAGATVKRFYDYYGFRTYTDLDGKGHFLLLIEDETSSESDPIWYWTDNFRKISQKLDFGDDSEYVEDWSTDEYGRISMTVTSGAKWHLDTNGNLARGELSTVKNSFSYARYFEDTDSRFIVGKNPNGVFIIDREKTELTPREQKSLVYFEDFIYVEKNRADSPLIDPMLFVMKQTNGEVIITNTHGKILLITDLSGSEEIEKITAEKDGKILSIKIRNEDGTRQYLL